MPDIRTMTVTLEVTYDREVTEAPIKPEGWDALFEKYEKVVVLDAVESDPHGGVRYATEKISHDGFGVFEASALNKGEGVVLIKHDSLTALREYGHFIGYIHAESAEGIVAKLNAHERKT